jgi:DNA-binding HxlR family transcriptional regulator
MPISIDEYLSLKGSVELLCEINPHGSRFEALLAELPITRPTLTDRLAQGREASLLDREAVSGELGTTHTHVLSPKGATIRLWLDDNGVTVGYERYNQARKEFYDQIEWTREELADPRLQLDDRAKTEMNLLRLKNRRLC